MKEYDLIVIGGGPAGYSAALEGARLGAEVALLEEDQLGGTCLNRGCIPTKTLLESVKLLETLGRAEEYGISCSGFARLEGGQLRRRKDDVSDRLRGGLELLLAGAKVHVIKGKGKLSGGNRVEIGGEIMTGRNIVVATGSRDAALEIPGAAYLLSSAEALELESIPGSICIIGGGVVGMEFATFYAGAGSKVHVLEALPRVLRAEDREIAGLLVKSMRKRGIEIEESCRVESVEKNENGFAVSYERNGENRRLETELALNAAGRKPNIEGVGLECCGVWRGNGGFIVTDEFLQTTAEHIYAAGDVIGGPLLAHAAFDEGITAAGNALEGNRRRAGERKLPRCIYTHPEIAAVGLTEEQAAERAIPIVKGYYPLSGNGRALAAGHGEGIAKVIADAEIGQVLGVHLFGESASEIIGSAVYALEGEFTCEELAGYVTAHPTISEVIKEAAADCRRNMSRKGR